MSQMVVETPEGPLQSLTAGQSGPTVVLLHGIQGTAAIWSKVMADLSADHRVIAPNLRGRGGSFAPEKAGAYAPDRFAQDLRAILTNVDGPAALVGWSMGCLVAFEYLRQYGPAGLSSLALVSGTLGPRMVDPHAVWFRGETVADLAAEAAGRAKRLGLTETATDLAVAGAWLGLRDADYSDVLPALDMPTFVLHGDQDSECPMPHARLMTRLIPKTRTQVWPGCGHVPMAHDAERFCQSMRMFLADSLRP